MLPLPVEWPHQDCEISAAAFVEAGVLVEQVHFDDVRDTRLWLSVLLAGLAEEKLRYAEAKARFDYAAMDESAAEQRDVLALAAVCRDHLRRVGIL